MDSEYFFLDQYPFDLTIILPFAHDYKLQDLSTFSQFYFSVLKDFDPVPLSILSRNNARIYLEQLFSTAQVPCK